MSSFLNYGFRLFLAVVYLTLVRGFDFNFDLFLPLETTGLVLIFVSVVSSTFNKLPFVLKVGVARKISEPNRSYSKFTKNIPLVIILPTVIYKGSFKGNNINPILTCFSQRCIFDLCNATV